jgi:lipid II:glycine glycyltransferase (peptidoglycan interpeptide bridge formation enzyme)
MASGLKHLPISILLDHELSSYKTNLTAPFLHFILEVDRPFEAVLKAYDPTTRNKVSKANRNGITVRRVELEEGLDAYYPIFYQTMMKLKVLPFEKRLFKTVSQYFQDEARLFLAYDEGLVVAGILAFEWNGTLWIWSNASDPRFLKKASNNAVYSAVIEYACHTPSLHYVDFGSTIPNTPHHTFKKGWGGDEKPIFRIAYPKPEDKASDLQKKIMTILQYFPEPIVQRLARWAYTYY